MLKLQRSFGLEVGLDLCEFIDLGFPLMEINVGLLVPGEAFRAQYLEATVFGAEELILFAGVLGAVICNFLFPTLSAATHLDLSTK